MTRHFSKLKPSYFYDIVVQDIVISCLLQPGNANLIIQATGCFKNINLQNQLYGLLFAFIKGAGNMTVTNSMLINIAEGSLFFAYFYFISVVKYCADFNLFKKLRKLL